MSRAPLQSFNNAGGATGTITSGIPTHFSSVGQPTVIARPVNTSTGGGVMTANELMFLTSTLVAPLPSAQPTALLFSNVTSTSLTVSFTAATGSPAGYIVLRKAMSLPVSLPAISVGYSAGAIMGDASVAYVGSATTFTDTGLTPDTNYFYAVYSYNGSGSTTNYLTTSPLQGNQPTLATLATEPTAQPTAISFTNVLSTTLTVSWVAATGSTAGYIVLRKAGSSSTDVPVDGTPYTIGGTLGTSTIAYTGSAVTFNDIGLSPSTQYFYDIFSYNGSGATINYLTTLPLEGSQTTLAPAPTISSFDPTSGQVGTSVVITGTNFSATASSNIVKFNGTLATVASSPAPTATSLTVSVPTGATNGKITVEVGGQVATSSTDFTVTAPVIVPSITDFNPKSGLVGISVLIAGTNFSTTPANNIVKFNGIVATVATSPAPTATSLTVTLPAGALSGQITVEVGGQSATSSATFTVITDTTRPTFGTNGTATSVAPGVSLAITADFVDAESNVVEAFVVQYRSVSASGSAPPDIQLTKGTGNNWIGTIPATSIGELGVEYKFKIKNGASLEETSPLNKVVINHAGGITIGINTTFSKSQSNYRIIGIPLILTANTVTAIFSDKLGGYDENVWRMYRYENGTINKLLATSLIEPGKGYWFLSTKAPSGNFITGAGTTVPVSIDEPFEITLSPGWNQIGNPYNFDISWNDVRAANPTLADKLSATARSYDGNVKEINEIKKFEGAYVSNTGTATVKIKIPVAKNPIINGRSKSKEIENPLSNGHWEVKFNLSNGLQHYTLGGIGMHPQASESVDAYDDFNIPRFFEYLEVKHPKQLYDMSYTKDVVPTQQEHTWNFSTESNQEGENITLAWDNSYFGNGDEHLWLMDVETGSVWDMRKESKVVVNYSPIRRWRVAFGSELYVKDATLPEQNSLVAVYPSPFDNEISMEVAIVEPAVVKLDILDLNGRNVKTLMNQQMNKGRYIPKWQSANNGSEDIATGVYIVRFQAGAVVQFKRIVKN